MLLLQLLLGCWRMLPTLAHGALHVAHDLAVLVIQELHADLGHLFR